jgi:integrase
VNISLDRKRVRERLAVRPDPYWQRLSKGCYLGFRRGPDTWHARFRGRDGKQQYQPLNGIGPDDFDGAKKAAESWIAQLAGSPMRAVKRDTVRSALESYLADLRRLGRNNTAKEVERRFKLTVWSDPIASISLESATRDDFEEWRERIQKQRPPSEGPRPRGRPRGEKQPRSVNRSVRAVVAGLNKAHELGHVGNPTNWKLKPLVDDVEDGGETAIFLTPKQRKSILDAASPRMRDYLRALELTGARPGELAAAKAGDFDGQSLRLASRKGKNATLRVRFVTLDQDGVEFFTKLAKDKFPLVPLLTEDGVNPWKPITRSRQFRKAVAEVNKEARGEARIPPGADSYSFRHARISELLQVYGIDPVTVAHQCGTSVVMIQEHYHRFIPSAMLAKLKELRSDSATA